MRNNFEHFDERLDRWWNESKSHNYADMNIGAIGGVEEIDSFRQYDAGTRELMFWGQNFNTGDIVAETKRILLALQALGK
jgi:hypothetical protein